MGLILSFLALSFQIKIEILPRLHDVTQRQWSSRSVKRDFPIGGAELCYRVMCRDLWISLCSIGLSCL